MAKGKTKLLANYIRNKKPGKADPAEEEKKRKEQEENEKERLERLKRYIEFEFKVEDNEDFIEKKISELKTQLDQAIFNLETHLTPDTFEMVTSQGEEFKDPSIYIGTGGMLVYYYRKIKYFQSIQDEEGIKEAKENFDLAFDTNIQIWQYQKMNKKNIQSFFMGKPGIMTLGYIVYNEFEDFTKAIQCLN